MGIIGWSNPKFSKLTSQKLYGRQWGELLMRSWELKGLHKEVHHLNPSFYSHLFSFSSLYASSFSTFAKVSLRL